MIWRFYPFSILVGLAAGSAVEILASIGGFLAIGLGLPDGLATDPLQRADVQIVTLATSLASSFAAGYMAARFAPGEELINACATGVMLALGIASYSQFALGAPSSWVGLLPLTLAIPLAVTGGLLVRGRAPSA